MQPTPIDNILSRLTRVRLRHTGQWSACCPAHTDNGPSLSIRETPEGSVLLHCFAGCRVAEIVASLGLNLSDLYPPHQLSGKEPKRTARLLTASQGLELLDKEAIFVAVAAANLAHGTKLLSQDYERLKEAVRNIQYVRMEASFPGGNNV